MSRRMVRFPSKYVLKWENWGHPSVNSGNMSRRAVRFPAKYVLKWENWGHPSVNSGNMSRRAVRFPSKYVLKWRNWGHPSVNSGNMGRRNVRFPAEYVLKWEIWGFLSVIPPVGYSKFEDIDNDIPYGQINIWVYGGYAENQESEEKAVNNWMNVSIRAFMINGVTLREKIRALSDRT